MGAQGVDQADARVAARPASGRCARRETFAATGERGLRWPAPALPPRSRPRRPSSASWRRRSPTLDARLAADGRRHAHRVGAARARARRLALPQARGAAAVPHAVRPGRHRRAAAASPRGPAGRRLHRRLPPALLRAQRGRARSRSRSRGGTPAVPTDRRPLAGRRLVRARGLGHVRHRRRRPPAPQAHPHAAVVGGPPAAQGAPRRAAPRWARSRCPPERRRRSGRTQLRFRPEEWGLPTRRARTRTSCSSTSAPSTPPRTACSA